MTSTNKSRQRYRDITQSAAGRPRRRTKKSVSTLLQRFSDFVGSAEFFRFPVRALFLGMAVISFAPALESSLELEWWNWSVWSERGVDWIVRGRSFVELCLHYTVLLIPAILCSSLAIHRRHSLRVTVSDNDPFVAIPVMAAVTRTTGEFLGVYLAARHVLGGALSLAWSSVLFLQEDFQGLSYLDLVAQVDIGLTRPSAVEWGAGIPLAQLLIAPFAGYLLILATRWSSETMGALAAIANNTRERE